MPACPSCNSNNAVGTPFCDNCGAELPPGGPSASRPNLGAQASATAGAVSIPPPAVVPNVLVTCENCQKQAPKGNYCDGCGHPLGTPANSPDPGAEGSAGAGIMPPPIRGTDASTTTFAAQIVVHSSGRIIVLPDDRAELRIGRMDPSTGNYPEIDLAIEPESVSAGVSRKHAMLRKDQASNAWTILDGDGVTVSANGTRVVSAGLTKKLSAGEAATLISGAEIILGAFKLTFK